MTTIKTRRSGSAQSVELRDGSELDVDEVEILYRGDELILRKKPGAPREPFDLLASMPGEFFEHGRQDPPREVRDRL